MLNYCSRGMACGRGLANVFRLYTIFSLEIRSIGVGCKICHSPTCLWLFVNVLVLYPRGNPGPLFGKREGAPSSRLLGGGNQGGRIVVQLGLGS
jgi:hypothetical protein